MKQHLHCHCHFKEQLAKFKAGKLGLLGGLLIVGHLLFHVAECLVLPVLLMAFHPQEVEAAAELTQEEFTYITLTSSFSELHDLQLSFQDSLVTYALRP